MNSLEREESRESRESRRAAKLLELRDKGIVSDQLCLLYGISGDLPDRDSYSEMSTEERDQLWEDRMTRRYGSNWRRTFSSLPSFLRKRKDREEMVSTHDWQKEGF